jgi:twitching motility protein PilI
MAARTSLRDYQLDLAERLRKAEAGRNTSMLGLQVGDEAWLVDLTEAAEVVPVPAITPVALMRPWFKGLANIRGNLFSVVDFGAFLGRIPVALADQSRLLLLGERFRLGAALLVDRSLGLRNPGQLTRQDSTTSAWARAEYTDGDSRRWKELDVAQLAQHPDFLAVGMS